MSMLAFAMSLTAMRPSRSLLSSVTQSVAVFMSRMRFQAEKRLFSASMPLMGMISMSLI